MKASITQPVKKATRAFLSPLAGITVPHALRFHGGSSGGSAFSNWESGRDMAANNFVLCNSLSIPVF
jgi:hypothetical protein